MEGQWPTRPFPRLCRPCWNVPVRVDSCPELSAMSYSGQFLHLSPYLPSVASDTPFAAELIVKVHPSIALGVPD